MDYLANASGPTNNVAKEYNPDLDVTNKSYPGLANVCSPTPLAEGNEAKNYDPIQIERVDPDYNQIERVDASEFPQSPSC